MAYSLAGLGIILKHNQDLYRAIQYFGGAYLGYIGAMTIWSTFNQDYNELNISNIYEKKEITLSKALKMGALTNILNPKAGIYFISIFTQFIGGQTSSLTKFFLATEVTLLTVLYFIFVAVGISHKYIREIYSKSRKVSERFLGLVLIALGVKIIFF